VVNNGCLTKYANYILTGFCGFVLPIDDITLSGIKVAGGNKLYWHNGTADIRQYSLQRSLNNTTYETINDFAHVPNTTVDFIDRNPAAGNNYYRLKLVSFNNRIRYSNTVLIKNTKFNTSCYPNPVESKLFITVGSTITKSYLVELSDLAGKKITVRIYTNVQNGLIEYNRPGAIVAGIYSLTITDLQNKEKQTYKIVFK
jgi:hypothetical protein